MNGSALSAVRRQGTLLLDETTVKEAQGADLNFFNAVKDPSNPIISRTLPWEGRGPYTWGDRLLYLSDQNKYRLYYTAFVPENKEQLHEDKDYGHYRWGMAESEDGIHWVKPDVHEVQYNGQSGICMLTLGPEQRVSNRTVLVDPRPDCPSDERFKGMRFSYSEGNYLAHSADGIHWVEYPDRPYIDTTSDIMHIMWDENIQKFVCYYKLWQLKGDIQDHTAPGGFRHDTFYATTFSVNERTDGITEIDAVVVTLHPDSHSTAKRKKVYVRSCQTLHEHFAKNDGGGQLSGAWSSKRVFCRAVSDDFLHWRNGQVVLACDEKDSPDANIQYAQVFWMGGYYLAFLTVHDERGHFEQQLAFSTDGVQWKRPWRGNVISIGAPGELDSGMITGPVDPVVVGSQMYIYYGGRNSLHTQSGMAGYDVAICRAIMRKEGFACWKENKGEIAVLCTQPLEVNEGTLLLNVNAVGGYVTAALLDQSGSVIPGFDHQDCIAVREDSTSYFDCFIPVRWKNKDALPAEKCEKITVELHFTNAEIYSILL